MLRSLIRRVLGSVLIRLGAKVYGLQLSARRNSYLRPFRGPRRALVVTVGALLALALQQGIQWVSTLGASGDAEGQSLALTIYPIIATIGGATLVGALLASDWVDIVLVYPPAIAIVLSISLPSPVGRVAAGVLAPVLIAIATARTRRYMQKLEDRVFTLQDLLS